MKRLKAFRYRIYPTPEQESLFRKTAGCCRLVYNLCLEQREIEWHRMARRPVTKIGQVNEITALKDESPFLREVPHHPLQQAVADLDRAYQNFFADLAKLKIGFINPEEV